MRLDRFFCFVVVIVSTSVGTMMTSCLWCEQVNFIYMLPNDQCPPFPLSHSPSPSHNISITIDLDCLIAIELSHSRPMLISVCCSANSQKQSNNRQNGWQRVHGTRGRQQSVEIRSHSVGYCVVCVCWYTITIVATLVFL